MVDKQKVIKGLECCAYKKNCNECPYFKGNATCMDDKDKDALELLKEQEAVKPILEQDSMVCGACGHEVIWQKMLGDGIWADEKLDYCPHCGQKVKWDE